MFTDAEHPELVQAPVALCVPRRAFGPTVARTLCPPTPSLAARGYQAAWEEPPGRVAIRLQVLGAEGRVGPRHGLHPTQPCCPPWKGRTMRPADTHRTVKVTSRWPPARVLMVMGVTDTDSSFFQGISLSAAVAFRYHVPDACRRHLTIRAQAHLQGLPSSATLDSMLQGPGTWSILCPYPTRAHPHSHQAPESRIPAPAGQPGPRRWLPGQMCPLLPPALCSPIWPRPPCAV